jgi:5-formyltetrahydrofolate cyclo-ligase
VTHSITHGAKKTLRVNMKSRRDALPLSVRKKAAVDVANMFMGHMPFGLREVVGFYWPIGSEIDMTLMAEALMEQGNICLLPRIVADDKPLSFRRYVKGMDLEQHKKLLVREPSDGTPDVKPTIVLVPLLAFDALGNRLGYGGGFYDRTLVSLAKQSNIMSVGVAYDFMQVPIVPAEPHDMRLDCVVTEKRVIICED